MSPPQAYKVCHIRDGRFMSYVDVLSKATPESRIEYRLNEWTKPLIKNSCLYAFREYQDASCFIRDENWIEEDFGIFECDVEDIWQKRFCFAVCDNLLLSFWEDPYLYSNLPMGAICCGQIKLNRMVTLVKGTVITKVA